ncbi:hypothetical protein HK107_04755 [Parvularcula sp. ZS-1/3]|uniref:Uncharacterized protein n=1 Tax=Parvularcula mediterranea TaxID=2732508 RepID=A0A7Y3RLB8_9PROT|nr:hypothetical protein [Parvularcula mediterranea]NNU15626.1 hypothetical protein [Parvularcula mediterranea]
MIDEDPPTEDGGRRTLGVIDGTATQLALAVLLLLPTVLACVFWPRVLGRMIPAIEPEGRRGAFLAPGAFFLISTLTSLFCAAIFMADGGGAMTRIGTEVSTAAEDGNVWKIAALILPLFLAAISIGMFAFAAGKITRVPDWQLTAAVRSGFYAIFAIGFATAISEPLSRLFGEGGTNGVFEPFVIVFGALMSCWFYGALLSEKAGWPRAALTGLIASVPIGAVLATTYS